MLKLILFLLVTDITHTLVSGKLMIYVTEELDYYDARNYCTTYYDGSLLRMGDLSSDEENIVKNCVEFGKLFWVMRESSKDACRKVAGFPYEGIFDIECVNDFNYNMNAFVCVTDLDDVDLNDDAYCSPPAAMTTVSLTDTSSVQSPMVNDTNEASSPRDTDGLVAGTVAGLVVAVLMIILAIVIFILVIKHRDNLPKMKLPNPKLSIPKPKLKIPKISFFKSTDRNVYEDRQVPEGSGSPSHTYAAMELPQEYFYVEPNAFLNNQQYQDPSPLVISRNVNYLVLEDEHRTPSSDVENKYETMNPRNERSSHNTQRETELDRDNRKSHVYENLKDVRKNEVTNTDRSDFGDAFVYDLAKHVDAKEENAHALQHEYRNSSEFQREHRNGEHVVNELNTSRDDVYDLAKSVQ